MQVEHERETVDEIGRVNRLYAVLSKVNEAIVRIREPQELYEAACRIAVEDGHFLLAWIGFVEVDTQRIRPAAKYGRDDGYLDGASLSLNANEPEGRGPTGVSLREGRAFINNDTANNPLMSPWRDEQLKRGYRASASFPLKTEGQTVGVITLYAGSPDFFDDEEVQLLTTLADDFSFALEATAKAQASVELARTRLLQDVALAASTGTSVGELCLHCLEAAGRHVGLTIGAVYTFNETEQSLHLVASIGLTDEMILVASSYNVRVDRTTVAAYAARERRIFATEDVPVSERAGSLLARTGIKGVRAIAAPLESGDSLLGTITLVLTGVGDFSEDERELVRSVAAIIGQTLENARLYEEAREAARLSDALNSANAAVHSTLEIDRVMQHALETGARAIGCDAGAIEMLEGDEWVVRYQYGVPARAIGTRLSKEEAPSSTIAALGGEPVGIDELGLVGHQDLKSTLAAPLIAKGTVIGCALFYASTPARRFTAAEIDFGRKLGSAVSLAIENARLYGHERNMAKVLQTALIMLPDAISDIDFASFYSTATEAVNVGGDFYDIFELDADRIGITIGDVSGSGVQAAVLTSLVRDTIRAFASEQDRTPGQVLTKANDIIYKATATDMFATVFFAILNRRNGRLVYSNAGHTAAAIAGDDGMFAKLTATGTLLGAFPGIGFSDSEARLGLGNLLFLYTDGLTEARRDGELYGEERLFSCLSTLGGHSLPDLIAATVNDVTSFAGNRSSDDLAILALRRTA